MELIYVHMKVIPDIFYAMSTNVGYCITTSCFLSFSGNGPSGINLSYMLSGNWPYYTGGSVPDEYLQMRMEPTEGSSLVEQVIRHNVLRT